MPKIPNRIHRIMQLRAAEVLARFGQRWHEMRVLRTSQRHHGKTVWKRREMLLEFMRRTARRNEMHFVEVEPPVGGAREAKMTAVDGIERAAKQRDAARMVFCGYALRLRGRQCASRDVFSQDFLMNCGSR